MIALAAAACVAIVVISVVVFGFGGHSAKVPAAGSVTTSTASFTVTSNSDQPALAAGRGFCASTAGTCTLRAAVEEAGQDAANGTSAVTVHLGAGHYTLGGLLLVPRGVLTIIGAGENSTIIDGAGVDRVFDVASGATLTLRQLTLTGGSSAVEGGAVRAYGATVNLDMVTISASTAAGDGGALFAAGSTVNLTNSTFSGDTGLSGGAVATLDGSTTITGCTFGTSLAQDVGGAVSISSGVALAISGSTFTGNAAENSGGGLAISGATGTPAYTVAGSTFTGNAAFADNGGGINTDGMLGPGTVGSLAVSGSTFTNDQAGNAGGAIASATTVTTASNTYTTNTSRTDPDVALGADTAPAH